MFKKQNCNTIEEMYDLSRQIFFSKVKASLPNKDNIETSKVSIKALQRKYARKMHAFKQVKGMKTNE